jgi:hypothetical protein
VGRGRLEERTVFLERYGAEERRRKMKLDSLPEQLFASAVGMDPLLDGFSGVLVEIY